MVVALNIPDHEGKVYLPEVMWPLFNSVLNVPCHVLQQNKVVQKLMQKIMKKYPKLPVNVAMDELCGNVLHFDFSFITAA